MKADTITMPEHTWKYQRTMPPFVKMVKRSSIFFNGVDEKTLD